MNVILAVELAHSSFYYYSIAILSYLGVLLLFGYYCGTCILTPDKNKKIFILLFFTIITFVAAILLVGEMVALGYVAGLSREVNDTDLAIYLTGGGVLGTLLTGLTGWGVPVLVNYYYFKQETMVKVSIQARLHFYATNRSWLIIRAGCIFIIVSFIFLATFIDQLFVKYTDWSMLWKVISALIELTVVIIGSIASWRLLRSNDWVFWWKPRFTKNEGGQT
ncbi:hypothetical protein [Schleiferilactobacillus perolens]|uniref:Uncharacterized protein n=1 Tax=Schleiferilactobacillus perolens DSM 12744 TaxID=1423792 RepID=A0A0R1MKN4_9LACO|nr:hypothetical protein [Schleiferilactobacillus perolens]KRL08057.1 hypothetical protein FD09_GL001703 [Schleiferilactobacillus perolens DSM 12744]